MSARAVVFAQPGRIELRGVTLRAPAADEVLVETRYSSISSGTERLIFDGRLPGFPQLRFPIVPGYEAAGVVVEIGAEVRSVAVGDEVFVGGSMCYTDVNAAFGGQSSHVLKKADQVVPLHGIPLAHAPLLALAATSLHGVLRIGEARGLRCAVIGMGAIGQLAARFLRARGADVHVGDLSAERLAHAKDFTPLDLATFGAPSSPGHGHGNGHGHAHAAGDVPFDVVFECTGKSALIATCARALRPRGTIVLLSYYDTLETPFVDVFVKEATLLPSREWSPSDLPAARDLIASGVVAVDDLAHHIVPIASYAQAYRTAFEDPSTLKVILQWA